MSDYLPAVLIPEILCRLPVESLLRFRCVSKEWCALISSPGFINTHLSHSPTLTATPLLLLRHLSTIPKKQEHYSVYLDSSETQDFTLVKELNFPFRTKSGNHFRVVGLCNGLFCLSDDLFGYTYTIMLWNPTIRKSLTLPKPAVHYGPYEGYMFCLGFGVDEKTHDFKVVSIAYLKGGAHREYTAPPIVEVYSLRSGSWKTVESKHIDCRLIEYFYSSVYLNGCIHWVCFRKNEDEDFVNSLLVFDLGDERFREMGLPQGLVHVLPLDLSVTLYGDQISMIWYEKGRDEPKLCNRVVVWVMNKYGDLESWIEKFVVVLEGGISHAIGFRGNGQFLVEKYLGDLLSYDLERKEFKDLGIHGVKDSFRLSKYIESLVLLDGSNGATADPCVTSDSGEATEGVKLPIFIEFLQSMMLQGVIDRGTADPFVPSDFGEATEVQTQLGNERIEKELLRQWYLSTIYAKGSLCG